MSGKLILVVHIAGIFVLCIIIAATTSYTGDDYRDLYFQRISALNNELTILKEVIGGTDLSTDAGKKNLYIEIRKCRKALKGVDFWTRYLEMNAYRYLNAPIPVEWETEVFEKFEKPYRREGYGLTVFENALNGNVTDTDSLENDIIPSIRMMAAYYSDSVTKNLKTFDHFYFANRLYLLNLAVIYTTGFECPDSSSIIPELKTMLTDVEGIYKTYNATFASYPLKYDYLGLYAKLKAFVNSQPSDFKKFDHYAYIRDYINPLFALNQQYIREYNAASVNLNDYTLNNNANSIFDKKLYAGQNTLGIYSGVTDEKLIKRIKETGKLLFYDPILSGNNERSCKSCHKPKECFTDTSMATALNIDRVRHLTRNTPSLVNVVYNHLLMLDGKHINLQNQARGVITNPNEMGGNEKEVLEKVMSCQEYKVAFEEYKKYTYKNKDVTFDHIISAITAYVGDFDNYIAPFDNAMNNKTGLNKESVEGFNLFMGKAQCQTCHYLPVFNGVRPPYISSEFEVIGVPADTNYSALSPDSGRADIYFSSEMYHAFRTNTLRNSTYTKPYMHNGVFKTMSDVLDFYNAGGGAGKGLKIKNQTLSSQPLHLTDTEKKALLAFIRTLDEAVPVELPPDHLPLSKDKKLNDREIGGEY